MLRISLCMALLASVAWASPTSPAEGTAIEETAIEGTQRDGKLFPIVQIVTFENGPCQQDNGGNGVCYSKAECDSLHGDASGTCAKGYGVCCSFHRTCGHVLTENSSYFVNPGFPNQYTSRGSCSITIMPNKPEKKVSKLKEMWGKDNKKNIKTCQIKLDFETFSIAGPNEGDCSNDTFIVQGANSGTEIPIICGENGGQHMYIDVDNTDGPIKLVVTTSSINFARHWKVQVTFIGENDPCKAPNRCLQYHKETTGKIESFNYVAPGQNGMLLNNLKYSICFAYVPDYCDVALTMDRFDIGGIVTCTNDYLGIGPEKFCGDKIDYGLMANATGPISLLVCTDDNNDRQEEGFSGSYTMMGC